MDIDKAIAELTDVRDKIFNVSKFINAPNNAERVEIYDLAIQAIREKQERDKGM